MSNYHLLYFMQSILFFGILSFLEWVFGHLPFFGTIGGALGVVMFIGWIVMMVKAHRGEYYKLPLFGNLADRLIDQIKV
jgi:uncharacterized membrane protein